MPVVAELAAIGTTGCAGAENGHARKEMIARFFLNGVYLECRWSSICEGVVPSSDVNSRETKASFVRLDDAFSKTRSALDHSLIQFCIVLGPNLWRYTSPLWPQEKDLSG